ncbi:hypothetical protein [Burkholderia sp. RS02]|uniref:hypothetical protein n=1 Tax=unclassified Burkholderia TaxID=2613784 RepID=UPI0032185BBF
MAINLFCYSSVDPDGSSALQLELIKERQDLFGKNFLISPVRDVTPMHVEIAGEHGFVPKAFSWFL